MVVTIHLITKEMLFCANEIMCNTLKDQICFKINLEIMLHGMVISYLTLYIMELRMNAFQLFLCGKHTNYICY